MDQKSNRASTGYTVKFSQFHKNSKKLTILPGNKCTAEDVVDYLVLWRFRSQALDWSKERAALT